MLATSLALGSWIALSPPSEATVEVEATPEPHHDPRARVVTHLGVGPWLAEPTESEPGRVSPGLATELDLGLQRGSWLWLGAVGAWGLFPGRDFEVHQVTAGAFVGIRPRVRRLWLYSRAGVSAGSVIGRSSLDFEGRPLVLGQLRVGMERAAANAERVRFGFVLGLDVGSRRTSVLASTGDAVGVGYVRGGVSLTVALDLGG